MKISICGKGGSGKSTVTALLAKSLSDMGKKVLVLDSDESNYGLHRQIGVELPQDFTIYFGGKGKVLEDMMMSNFTHQFFESTWKLDDVPDGYFSKKDNIMLMAGGKIHTANEGCACPIGNIITQFIDHLELGEDEYALMDMEAGVEHFGRGTDNGVDVIIMVVDPSYESLRLTEKIKTLAEAIQKPVFYILNKVTDSNIDAMKDKITEKTNIICEIPAAEDLMNAGLDGSELKSGRPEVHALAEYLEENKGKLQDSYISDLA